VLGFGPFQVDLTTHELRKFGNRVRIPEQSFQVLAVLLESPGELIPRETLRSRLWPPDTYVDFERSLTVAMNRLRAALADSAEKPRYIETLPRLGYRFIATVEVVSNGNRAASEAPAEPATTTAEPESSLPPLESLPPGGAPAVVRHPSSGHLPRPASCSDGHWPGCHRTGIGALAPALP